MAEKSPEEEEAEERWFELLRVLIFQGSKGASDDTDSGARLVIHPQPHPLKPLFAFLVDEALHANEHDEHKNLHGKIVGPGTRKGTLLMQHLSCTSGQWWHDALTWTSFTRFYKMSTWRLTNSLHAVEQVGGERLYAACQAKASCRRLGLPTCMVVFWGSCVQHLRGARHVEASFLGALVCLVMF